MTARPERPIDTVFKEAGSLSEPGPIGRIVRLLFGVWLLWFLYALLTAGPQTMIDTTAPRHLAWWFGIAVAFYLTPYVVNIGFTKSWGRRPQFVIAALAAVAIVLDLELYGTWWAPPLGVVVLVWLVYFAAHLGISFVLSSVIATPGCEMRAIPHLWTLISGRPTKEHYCPGVLNSIDAWETRRARS